MLTGYFDEGKERGFTVVCGWIARVKKWEQFEVDWKLLLSSHNLPYFHMKEFSQSVGPCAKWKNAEGTRRKFLGQAADVIHSTAERAFICYVNHEAFSRIDKQFGIRSVFRSPYAFAGRTCVSWANAWSRRLAPSQDVEYIFEDGGPDKSGLLAVIERHHELSLPIFKPSRDIPGKRGSVRRGAIQLQASDFLAYEIRKFVMDHAKYKSGERTPRKSLALLRTTPADIQFYGYERLLDLCRAAAELRNRNQ
jgi:hypothetical protein